jgi:hypothetical protein
MFVYDAVEEMPQIIYKLIVTQLVKFNAIYGTRSFIYGKELLATHSPGANVTEEEETDCTQGLYY